VSKRTLFIVASFVAVLVVGASWSIGARAAGQGQAPVPAGRGTPPAPLPPNPSTQEPAHKTTYEQVIKIALLRPNVRTSVMEEETTEGTILKGFAAARPPDVIIYAYTKKQYRNKGICRALLQHLGMDLTSRIRVAFWTDDTARKLMNGRGRWLVTYDASVVRYPKEP